MSFRRTGALRTNSLIRPDGDELFINYGTWTSPTISHFGLTEGTLEYKSYELVGSQPQAFVFDGWEGMNMWIRSKASADEKVDEVDAEKPSFCETGRSLILAVNRPKHDDEKNLFLNFDIMQAERLTDIRYYSKQIYKKRSMYLIMREYARCDGKGNTYWIRGFILIGFNERDWCQGDHKEVKEKTKALEGFMAELLLQKRNAEHWLSEGANRLYFLFGTFMHKMCLEKFDPELRFRALEGEGMEVVKEYLYKRVVNTLTAYVGSRELRMCVKNIAVGDNGLINLKVFTGLLEMVGNEEEEFIHKACRYRVCDESLTKGAQGYRASRRKI